MSDVPVSPVRPLLHPRPDSAVPLYNQEEERLDIADGVQEDIEFGEDMQESGEAEQVNAMPDPGAPTAKEVEEHCVSHLPHRSWCASCVEGRARDRAHRVRPGHVESHVPEVVFDYAFFGSRGETETQVVQVARDRRSHMLFAHLVPRKGLTFAHGASQMIRDLEILGYNEVVLKCDNEPALKAVQKEVAERRTKTTRVENSPKGDSKANGAAERAVQAVGEQLRVLRCGLQQRLGARVPGGHDLTAWLVEHAADLLNKVHRGEDGRTAYQRVRGKPFRGQLVEFGEKVHRRSDVKRPEQGEQVGRSLV